MNFGQRLTNILTALSVFYTLTVYPFYVSIVLLLTTDAFLRNIGGVIIGGVVLLAFFLIVLMSLSYLMGLGFKYWHKIS